MAESNEIDPDIRAPKRARVSVGNGCSNDRVVLNVGGKTFVTAASTLTSNSTYFEAMFSQLWNADGSSSKEEIFLDQDPVAFGKLLAYMRQGLISVDDIDTGVLAQAEFLGMDKLLRGVKVRAYLNLNPTFAGTDEEADAAFMEEHGGILEALSAGIVPGACKEAPFMQKDYAMLEFPPEELEQPDVSEISTTCNEDDVPSGRVTLIGALNWLSWHGYTKHEPDLGTASRRGNIYRFSRPRRNKSSATGIFTPSTAGAYDPSEDNWKKQYALIQQEKLLSGLAIQAPAVLDPSSGDGRGRHNIVVHDNADITRKWAQENGFSQREKGLGSLFYAYIKFQLQIQFPRSSKVQTSFKIVSKKLKYFQRQDA